MSGNAAAAIDIFTPHSHAAHYAREKEMRRRRRLTIPNGHDAARGIKKELRREKEKVKWTKWRRP